MKTTGMYKIWQVIYPVGIYYVVASIAFYMLTFFMGEMQETYMLRQMICAALTIPFVLTFYRQDQAIADNVYGKRQFSFSAKTLGDAGLAVLLGALLGIGVNNVIAMTPLMEQSAGFAEANEAFFAGQVVYELLGSCLLIPIAEELLYRGVVYRRLRLWLGVWPAVAVSALIFGAIHVNLVQFLYAGILGLLLAFLMEKSGFLYAPVLAHIAANVAAVVRQETGWLSFAYEPTAEGIGVTVVILAVAAGLLAWQVRAYRKGKQA